ncbi:MAG: SDR family NAD(P)-dependent oxidoreductase [Myxococcales bacterium]|nr:SDR family NAD(P)-dependent oxidoreductase [Myxococcales bacterium]
MITGASIGLGLAISRRLIERTSHRLLLTARASSLPRFAKWQIQQSERTWLRALDVTDAEQRRAVVEEANAAWGGIDVLINNAGMAYRSVVEHVTEQDRLAQMDINYRSPMELTRLVLPHMRSQRWGRILNVSSVGGMMAMPTMSVYSASKFALEGASEALWYEVRPWNIRVSLIQPGFINSDGFEKVRWTGLSHAGKQAIDDPYYNHYRFMEGFVARVMRMVPAGPERVASAVVRTIQARRPPLRVPATLDAHLFALLRRLLPRRVYHRLLYACLPGVREWGREEKSALSDQKHHRGR